MEDGCRGRSRLPREALALCRQHTLTLVYALFQHLCCPGLGQSHRPGQTRSCSLFRERVGCDPAFKASVSDLLLRGTTAEQGDAQKAAGETPAACPRRSAPNASPNELPKPLGILQRPYQSHPKYGSSFWGQPRPWGAAQGSEGGCSVLPTPVARCQPASASAARRPPSWLGGGGGKKK